MINQEKEDIIKAAKELYDVVNTTRLWQKIMFCECPDDEITDKLKAFNEKYQKWYGDK